MDQEIKGLLERQAQAFEEFKSKHSEQLAEEIKKGTADVVRKEEVDRINASLTDLGEELKAVRRARLFAADAIAETADEYKSALADYMRDPRSANIEWRQSAQYKNLTTTTGGKGGFAVPELIDSIIQDRLKLISPVRSVANVVTVSTPDYKKLVNIRGTASGWVGETATRPNTDSPTLFEVAPPVGEIYAFPKATQTMLEDVFFDAVGWVTSEIVTEFAKQEGIAFISGNGSNRPKGFLDETLSVSGDATRTFGHLQIVKTGVNGGFKNTTTTGNPADTLIEVVYAMAAPHRAQASWMMNRQSLEFVRKFRNVDGDYVWRYGIAEGQPDTLLGYPVIEAEDMPAVATGNSPIAFGNWSAGYTIVDRVGLSLLQDPYTDKPYIGFYARKRVGGKIVDSDAIKLVQTAT
jgi:HK97 family phage major capsid protein